MSQDVAVGDKMEGSSLADDLCCENDQASARDRKRHRAHNLNVAYHVAPWTYRTVRNCFSASSQAGRCTRCGPLRSYQFNTCPLALAPVHPKGPPSRTRVRMRSHPEVWEGRRTLFWK